MTCVLSEKNAMVRWRVSLLRASGGWTTSRAIRSPERTLYDCMDLEKDVKCHMRSLCAALLWEKVKSLYPLRRDDFES